MDQLHLHPMVVHFPIALFISAFLFELMSLVLKKESLHKAALYMFSFAALFSIFAVKTGEWEEHRLNLHHPLLEKHEDFATITMWIALVSLPVLYLIKRKWEKYFRAAFLIIALTVSVTVSLAAYNGGKMVYEYGVGVDL